MSDSTEGPSLVLPDLKYPDILSSSGNLTIVCSPYPEALMASALLCRAALRAKQLFQVTYVEPVISSDMFISLLEKFRKSVPLFVGIEVVGTVKEHPKGATPIMIGPKQKELKADYVDFSSSLGVSAYGLVGQKNRLGPDEFLLSALGIIAQYGADALRRKDLATKRGTNSQSDVAPPMDSLSEEVVRQAINSRLLRQHVGFRIFGINRFSLIDALSLSISPYLPSVTGDVEVCEKILDDANIPASRKSQPLSSYSQQEQRQIFEQLAQKPELDVSKFMGADFLLLQEKPDSPLYHFSNLLAMVHTMWATGHHGETLAILLGDRAGTLRNVLEMHIKHTKNVISAVELLKKHSGEGKIESLTQKTHVTPPLMVDDVQSDVGRIALNTGICTGETILIPTATSTVLIWREGAFSLASILKAGLRHGLHLISTSKKSVQVSGSYEETQEQICSCLDEVYGGG